MLNTQIDNRLIELNNFQEQINKFSKSMGLSHNRNLDKELSNTITQLSGKLNMYKKRMLASKESAGCALVV